MKQYIVDAFTDRLFGGNPAAVLPCGQMPPADWMLSVAIENNYSETAFVVKTGPEASCTFPRTKTASSSPEMPSCSWRERFKHRFNP